MVEAGLDAGVVLGTHDVADAQGDDLRAVAPVEHGGSHLVDDFGQTISILRKLRMRLVYRKILRREELVREADTVRRFARGDDSLLDAKQAAGLENVVRGETVDAE